MLIALVIQSAECIETESCMEEKISLLAQQISEIKQENVVLRNNLKKFEDSSDRFALKNDVINRAQISKILVEIRFLIVFS